MDRIREQSSSYLEMHKKGKAIPVTGHEGPQGCETSRLPHFLDNRLTDGNLIYNGPLHSRWYNPNFSRKLENHFSYADEELSILLEVC
jgi:hypothetical protein